MNNMYGQQFYGNYYQQPQWNGMGYQQQPMTVPLKNALTEEEVNILKNRNKVFSLSVTREEMLAEMCLHKQNGEWTFSPPMNDGDPVICRLCGESFIVRDDYSDEEIYNIVLQVKNLLHNIKLILDMNKFPYEATRDFLKCGALIDKIPQIYKLASSSFNEATSGISNGMTGPGFNNSFDRMNAFGLGLGGNYYDPNMFAQGGMYQPGMTPPPNQMYNNAQAMGQQAYPPNQMYNNVQTMGQPSCPPNAMNVPIMQNPLGAGAVNMGYQPNVQQMYQDPNQFQMQQQAQMTNMGQPPCPPNTVANQNVNANVNSNNSNGVNGTQQTKVFNS